MLSLGAITNANPVIDKKVKYFHDCFHYWLLPEVQKLNGFPENHLTYLERMAFRGQTLQQMHQSTRKSLEHWLNQPEFDTEKDEFAQKVGNKQLISTLKSIVVKQGPAFDLPLFYSTTLELIASLNGEDGLEGTAYFHEVLKSVVSCLQCPHDLAEHQAEISGCAKWMVAEFVRHGFDLKELGKTDGVFGRILKFRELKTSKKPHQVRFPLPTQLEEKRNKPGFKRALKGYTDANPFLTQFEGMLYALREEKNGEVLLRVDNMRVETKQPFRFEYNGVTFLTLDQIETDKKQWSEGMAKDFEAYLGAADGIIAKVPLKFKTTEQAIVQARFLVHRALDAFAYATGYKGARLPKKRVYFLLQGGSAIFHYRGNDIIIIRDYDTELLHKFNNSVPMPEIIEPEVREYMERCDRIFFKGLACEDPDEIVSYFWQYWEASFGFGEYSGKKKAEKVIKDLSKMLAKSIDKPIRQKLALVIYNYAMNNVGNLGIPQMYFGKEFDWKNPEITVHEISGYTNYPFLRELIEHFERIDQAQEEQTWETFYTDFLWQLYEQRNMINHEGKYCPATLERLQFFFKQIVSRWRAILFNELDRKEHRSVEEVIGNLVLRS